MSGTISEATLERVVKTAKRFDVFPSAAELAEQLGLSRRTIHAALQEAQRRGLIGHWNNLLQERMALWGRR